MERIADWKSHGGRQQVWRHASSATLTDMTFALFLPPGEGPFPLVWYLSGLTCTHANVMEKGEYRRACAELGLALVAPDTSPRGDGVADSPDHDLGQGAGFYVDATEAPWAPHFAMRRYIAEELPALLAAHFPVSPDRQAITGHSMGGHGALTLALTQPGRFRAVAALAPIVAPSRVPWGRKAFAAYLGPDEAAWARHDAVALIEAGARPPALRVDVGAEDPFLARELRPELLSEACAAAHVPLELAVHAGYDHSYYFVSTFLADQLHWLAGHLADES
jgi:S-formylglutathione hydrolase